MFAMYNVMRIAISFWQNCIAPVFDYSKNLLLIDIVNNSVVSSEAVCLEIELPFQRAEELSRLATEVVICGAISRTQAMALLGKNIGIISDISGSLEEVISLFIRGQLANGCMGRQQRHRHRRGQNQH
jgi:predicted Fe-Mo cluster-binding NifX family protein